jgi:pre-mRNA-splicing factor CWC26
MMNIIDAGDAAAPALGERELAGGAFSATTDGAEDDAPIIVGASDDLISQYKRQTAKPQPPSAAKPQPSRFDSSDDDADTAAPATAAFPQSSRVGTQISSHDRPASKRVALTTARFDSSDDDNDIVAPAPAPAAPAAMAGTAARFDSSDEDDAGPPVSAGLAAAASSAATMSTGHAAGLKTADQFRTDDRAVREAKVAAQRAGAAASSGNSATVFRDKEGRVVDAHAELERQRQARAVQDAVERARLAAVRAGTVQVEAAAARAAERERLKSQPLMRKADDQQLDERLRSAIHEEDPMAPLMARKARKREQAAVAAGIKPAGRPAYKGPPAPLNRFGIKPGYRWDGVDRTTGFERRAMAAGVRHRETHARKQVGSMGSIV